MSEALKAYSPTKYKIYPSCARELGIEAFLNYVAVNGVVITENFGLAFIPDYQEVDYAFEDYASYDYVSESLPPHYACFNVIQSGAKVSFYYIQSVLILLLAGVTHTRV